MAHRVVEEGSAPEGLRRAQQVALGVVDAMQDESLVGMSELDIAQLVDSRLSRQGVVERWCPTLVGAGIGTLVCHPDFPPQPHRRVSDGDVVMIDASPVVDGWYGDASRVWTVGDATSQSSAIVDDALAIQRAGIAFAQPGMEARELFTHVNSLIEDAGYRLMDLLGNVGHDIGTTAYQQGFIDAGNPTPMWGGWTLEPHIGNGQVGAKFEDIMWLWRSGVETL